LGQKGSDLGQTSKKVNLEGHRKQTEREDSMFGLRGMTNRRKDDKKNGGMRAKACHVIDLSRAPCMTYGAGVAKGNPKRCLKCGQVLKKDEAWRKYTSADDPEYGRYSVIVHRDYSDKK
jgi:hypothetical protein